jgi:hypothetical protein
MEVLCPYGDCKTIFVIPASYAGKKVKCAKCKRRFLVGATPGAPSRKVDDGEAARIQGPTRAVPAQDALERVGAGDALEPISKTPTKGTPAKTPAAKADELSLDVAEEPKSPPAKAEKPPADAVKKAEPSRKPSGPSALSASLDSMSLVGGAEEKSSTAETMRKLEEDEKKAASSPGDDLESAGLIVDHEEKEDEKGKKKRPSNCPHCGCPASGESAVCPICGERYDAPVKRKKKKGRGSPFKALVTLVCLILIAGGGFIMWEKAHGRDPLQTLLPAIRKVQEMTKGATEKVKEEAQQAVAPDTILVVTEEKVELEGSSSPLSLRRGQPVIQKEVAGNRIKVVVRTPDGDFEGQVARSAVKEDPSFERADLLGYDKSQPKEHQSAVTRLFFQADGKFAASVAKDGKEVNLWNAADGKLVRAYHGHPASPVAVGFVEKGTIASVSSEGGMRIWDPITTATLRKVAAIKGDFVLLKNGAACLDLQSGKARLWDMGAVSVLGSTPQETSLKVVRVPRKESVVIALTEKGKIQTLDLPTFEAKEAFDAPEGTKDFDLSPSGDLVAVFPETGKKVLILDRRAGQKRQEVSLADTPRLARFCGSETRLAVVTAQADKVHVFSLPVRTAQKPKVFDAPAGATITALEPSPDGQTLGLGRSTGAVQFLSLESAGTDTGTKVTAPGDTRTSVKPAPGADEKKAKRHYDFVHQFIANKKLDSAKSEYEKLVREFPDSPYATKAREELEAAGVKLEAVP